MLTKAFFEKIDKLTEELRAKSANKFNVQISIPPTPPPRPKGKRREMRKRPDGKRVRKGTV